MTGRVIFMTEEASMGDTLRNILPKIVPGIEEVQHWISIDHQGKNDLQRSFPRKLIRWQNPKDRFLVLRDNDGANCKELKQRLLDLVPDSPGRAVIVRLVCEELEGWFLGDLDAVQAAYPSAARHRQFRALGKKNPDVLNNASDLLADLTGTRAKRIRAQEISSHMEPGRNRSKSFEVFSTSVRRLFHQDE